MSWKTKLPRYLHIELSTFCNAACPLCPRYYHGTDLIRPDLNLSQITLSKFKQYFSKESIERLDRILYCGTLGDPIMAKDAFDIFEYVHHLNPNCSQYVNTNGGIRDEYFWRKMGKLFQKDNMKVVFSIDGLEDTNHIYRRNVNWSKLISNVNTFIDAGGRADWEFLIFHHNEHQIEKAKLLAKELGFDDFKLKKALGFEKPIENLLEPRMVFNRDGKVAYKIYPPTRRDYQNANADAQFQDNYYDLDMSEYHKANELKYFPKTKNKLDQFSDHQASDLGPYEKDLNKKIIKCKSIFNDFTEIYVNASGILFPCCFVGTRFDSNIDNFLDYQIKSKISPRSHELDLNLRPLEDILNSGVLEEIFYDSWNKSSIKDGKLAYCSETCGENSPLDKINELMYHPPSN